MNDATWIGVAFAALAMIGTIASNIISLFRYKVEIANTKEMLQLQAKAQYQEKQIQELTSTVDEMKVKQEQNDKQWEEKLNKCEEKHELMHDEIMVMRMMVGKPKDASEVHVPLPPTEKKQNV